MSFLQTPGQITLADIGDELIQKVWMQIYFMDEVNDPELLLSVSVTEH